MSFTTPIKAIVMLGIDGKRLLAQYYDEKINSRQFERQLFAKTKTPKSKDEIIVLEGVLVVHRFLTDSHIYVVGSRTENPLVLDGVLNCLVDVIKNLTSDGKVDNNSILDNLSKIILVLDEICDGGMILEMDSDLIIQRISQSQEDSVESIAQKATKFLFGL